MCCSLGTSHYFRPRAGWAEGLEDGGGGGGSVGFNWEDQSALAEYKGVRL